MSDNSLQGGREFVRTLLQIRSSSSSPRSTRSMPPGLKGRRYSPLNGTTLHGWRWRNGC